MVVASPGEGLAEALCVKTVPKRRPPSDHRASIWLSTVSGLGVAASAGPGCNVLVIFRAAGCAKSNACPASDHSARGDFTPLLTNCLR